jgi:hypothetical protein
LISQKQYLLPAGISWIQDPELAYVTILFVSREDKVQREVDGTPSDSEMEFQYDATRGKILFDPDVPGTEELFGSRAGLEKIKVIYKV